MNLDYGKYSKFDLYIELDYASNSERIANVISVA